MGRTGKRENTAVNICPKGVPMANGDRSREEQKGRMLRDLFKVLRVPSSKADSAGHSTEH